MRTLLAIAVSAAALCAAAVTMKPGYRYHREVLPSDRVPVDLELVMSNYLHDAGYVPSHVTNTETVVYNVTNNFTEVRDVTNNFYEVREFTNVFHQVTNILTRETVEITNNVTRNFYTEHWYTNNLYEVREFTNVVHEVNEVTNNIYQIFSNEYRNVVYETTNRTEYVTNNVTDEIWHTVVYSNVYENVISNRWIYDHRETHVTNNLVTWATNVLTEVREFTNNFTDVFWYTNNVTLNVTNNFYEEHWHTNNIHTVETNEFYNEIYNTVIVTNSIVVPVTNNFYNETWVTNNIVLDRTNNIHTVTFSNVYWTVHEDFYHTNYETRVVAETNYTHEVHTNVEEYYIFTTEEITNTVVQLREITNVYVQSNVTENVFNAITNNYSNWYTDRISFTNGTERHEIDALNKRYAAYRRVVERYDGPYWTSDKFSHVFGTNQVPLFKSGGDVAFATFGMLSIGNGEDSRDSLDVKASDIHLTGYVVPILDFLDADSYSEQQGYDCWPVLLGFKVAGGYYGVTAGTTNYVTATTVPGIGDYLIGGYAILGANYVYTDNPVLTFKGSEYAVFHYCLREDGTLRWIQGAEPDGRAMTLTSGKTGAVVPSSEYSHTTYTRHDGGVDVWTTNWTHYVSELADFNDLLHYGSIWTAEDVVTNRVFIETMEDAMYPYTFASYTNMVQAAGYARQTAADAQTVVDYMETADQRISAAISTATADAVGAKNDAYSYMRAAQTANASAQTAAGDAQTAQAKAEFAYDLIQTFTNWFYEAVNAGQVVTNVHNYYAVDQTARDAVTTLRSDHDKRLLALEEYDPSIAVTSEGMMTYPSAPKYRIPLTLKESGFSTTPSHHPNKTFTFGRIWRGRSDTGGDDTIEICYRNEDYPNAEFEEAANFCSYHLGLTILWNKNTGKWRVYRLYSPGNAWYYETEAYSTDLDHVWSGKLGSWTATYTPTTTHTFVGTPQSIDLATQAELSSEATARGNADTSIRTDFAAADLLVRSDLMSEIQRVKDWAILGTRVVFDVTKYRSAATCSAKCTCPDNPLTSASRITPWIMSGSGSTGVTAPASYTISNPRFYLTENSSTSQAQSSRMWFTVTYDDGTVEQDFIFLGKTAASITSGLASGPVVITFTDAYVRYLTSGSEASPGSMSNRGWRLTGKITFTPVNAQ